MSRATVATVTSGFPVFHVRCEATFLVITGLPLVMGTLLLECPHAITDFQVESSN